ncbi:MAG: alpha/beta hydrolase-fold protein [Parabacteroides sp.]|nr:alpha/beta hydrolase-fold protein [Parabacteroides sp.]
MFLVSCENFVSYKYYLFFNSLSDRKYAIYLPAGYNESERDYPVLYLLHPAGPRGTTPNQQAWIYYGELKQYLDKAIASGEITPMIVVTPDANNSTRTSYYNDADGQFPFEDFFFKEFIPYIEKNYRIRTEKGSRAIAGASAGGGGAICYAFHHPDMFAVCCGLSAAVREFGDNIRSRFPDIKESEVKEWYKQYDVFNLVKSLTDNDKNQFKLYLDCGDDDALSTNNASLHAELNKIGYPHEFRVYDGAHNWVYWRMITPNFMKYLSSQFIQ